MRVRVERDVSLDQSLAVAEVLNHQMTWTRLAEDAPGNWWHGTPAPHPNVDALDVLDSLADLLLRRAADILAPHSTTPILSPRVLDAVSALLATTHGYNGERRIEPDEITWAKTHGGALHILEHADGGVTFGSLVSPAPRPRSSTRSGTMTSSSVIAMTGPGRWLLVGASRPPGGRAVSLGVRRPDAFHDTPRPPTAHC